MKQRRNQTRGQTGGQTRDDGRGGRSGRARPFVAALALLGAAAGGASCGGGSPDRPGADASAGSGGAIAGDTGGAPGAGGAGAGGAPGSGGGTVRGTGGGTSTGGATATGGATGAGGAAGGNGGATAGTGGAAGRAGTGGGTAGRAGTGGNGAGGSGAGGATATSVAWTTRTLLAGQVSEGADAADVNGDGVGDLVAGPVWFDGARDFAKGGQLIPTLPTLTMTQYSLFFLSFVDDVNGDGRPDVIAIGDAGGANGTGNPNAFWYENPGPAALAQNAWPKHAIISGLVADESPAYLDLVGDAKKELLFIWCQTTATNGQCPSGQLGYARPGADPTAAWTFTPIGGSFSTAWTHGLGAGDVDGDGLRDVVERTGWWRQQSATTWERHAFDFWMGSTTGRSSNWGGSEMYVYDVDGDGDGDVVTVLAAHQYGLAWFEHQGTGAATTFAPHEILPTAAAASNVSQLHAMAMGDINGDGLPDIVTGKRFYAHDTDPGTTAAPIIAWFELQRTGGSASFLRHDIHADSGVGCNFIVRDLNGDGLLDVFTSSKRGTFLHLQRRP